ncbi:MAG TPA: hypothetical protein VFS09_11345, partial [Candidatus Eisenbacteria bacterium]|nr:hypothetical protein [Candidatus Eisenbacteria bacterium]
MSRRVVAGLVALSVLTQAPSARACMICDQDKVAATYDFAVVSAAAARHHRMLFGAVEGPVKPDDPALARRLRSALGRVRGVDAGTVRVSLAPAAISLAWNPVRTTETELLAAVRAALRPAKLGLRPIDSPPLPAPQRALRRTSGRRV